MSGVTLVTGGSGFVGKHLVEQLRASGDRVRNFDLAPSAHEDDIQGSITDEASLLRAMQDVTSVFHLAGNAQLWAKDPLVFDIVNRLGTLNTINAAIKTGVQRFVHCSSLTTLVGRSTPIGVSSADETVRLDVDDMLGAYPRSKMAAERLVEQACRDGLDAVIVLPTEPLGPGDDSLTPPTQMILDFANGKTPAYIDCMLNFVPVEALARGMIAAREKGVCGARYLLGGENVPMHDLLAKIEQLSGRATPKTKMPYWVALAAGAVDTHLVSAITGKPPKAPITGVRLAGRQVFFSSDKAARDLGWQAGDINPALQAMLDWAHRKKLLG